MCVHCLAVKHETANFQNHGLTAERASVRAWLHYRNRRAEGGWTINPTQSIPEYLIAVAESVSDITLLKDLSY